MTGVAVRMIGWLIGAGVAALAVVGLASPTQAATTDFITTWDPGSAGSFPGTVVLPLEASGSYDFYVDWGDNSPAEHITSDNASHQYANYLNDAPFTVTISFPDPGSKLTGWRFNDTGDKHKIRTVNQWGGRVNLGNNGGYFRGCLFLTSNATDAPDLTGTTNLSYAFADTDYLNGGLATWNTSGVTSMESTFEEAIAFNQNIGGWNTSNVVDMSDMFARADAFNQNIGGWNTGNVTDMSSMFYFAEAFNQNVGGWNTSKVTDMSYMFDSATAFNQNIGGWNTGSVKDMSYMFKSPIPGPSVFNQNIGGWNTSNVTKMTEMFAYATAFNQDLGGWNTSQVNDMSYMFLFATAFNQDLGGWNTSNVANMEGMFGQAKAFNQNLSRWNIGSAINLVDIFSYSGVSGANYGAALIGWAAQPVKANVVLAARDIQYSCAARAARQSLIDNHGWVIFDAGWGPCVSVSPAAVTFDPTTVNQTASGTITVTNPGGSNLNLPADALRLSGADAGQYSLSVNTCSAATVPPAGSCTATVTFSPTNGGVKSASLRVASNATSGADTVALTGTGVQPPAAAQPTAAAQTAKVNTPTKIQPKGKTVLLTKAVQTNAGQQATAKVTVSPKSKDYSKVTITKSGKVTIRTTGKKKLKVTLSLKAPATDRYQAYTYTKKWKVQKP